MTTILIMILGIFFNTQKIENVNYYAETAIVTELDRENDIVTCTNFVGIEWQFFGCEDWQNGDICSMIMNDNGTEIIYDDIIISVKYSGYIK